MEEVPDGGRLFLYQYDARGPCQASSLLEWQVCVKAGWFYLPLKKICDISVHVWQLEPSWSALQLRLVETALDMKCHGHYTGFFILKSGVLLVSFSQGKPLIIIWKNS